ncbi:MAG TPA: hypothetical protein DCY85_01320 [Firmicutes bacterium]|nr:hypothetical protein [Bacillota bacterium]HBE05110.1 hypothetical protein [Bacillota bacterium]HBR23495.1 hypothetical protein [Bacillota bacterium]HCF89106.1 hypothetical protein [Bacillota bacterium]HCF93278.1 hypothetical protein [Bacillota bacterium]
MRKVLIILILGAIIIMSGCGATMIAVSGIIRGSLPNTVIAGATVTAMGESSFSTVTGADGSYAYCCLPAIIVLLPHIQHSTRPLFPLLWKKIR